MGMDRRPKVELKRPAVADDGFNVLSVEHLFLPFEFRHGVDSILMIRVEDDFFERKRIAGKLRRCLGLFNRSAARVAPQAIAWQALNPFQPSQGYRKRAS
jgi:hypothetical protein